MSKVQESEVLLNTREAARLLRVSEASIRRWSDSGLLSARRVGGRRERRFERSVLERFLGQATGGRQAPQATSLRIGGASFPIRGHFAPIYSTDVGGLRLTVPFIADGLRAGHTCFLVAQGQLLERYGNALATEEGVDFAAATQSGQLVVLSCGLPGGDRSVITAKEAIANWERLFAKALSQGASSLRIVGEMACERPMFGSDAEMMAYEEAYDLMVRRFPALTLCAYDARAFGGETILRMLKAHPDMFQQHLGLFLS
jgi:excisionase family DNA binding protein